jgi:hypothetical protein
MKEMYFLLKTICSIAHLWCLPLVRIVVGADKREDSEFGHGKPGEIDEIQVNNNNFT